MPSPANLANLLAPQRKATVLAAPPLIPAAANIHFAPIES